MGTRWHTTACITPHVIVNKSTKSPHCLSCNSCPDIDSIIANLGKSSPVPPLPLDEEPGTNLNLFWPSVVSYAVESKESTAIQQGAALDDGKESRELPHRKASSIYPSTLAPTQFRLLSLMPSFDGDVNSPVHGNLEAYSHDDCPEYETVSYTWGGEEGDSKFCRPVFIGPYWDILLQTKNCWDMINLMRPRLGLRVVWIDAICINQNDIEERQDQVAKMGRIYEGGMRVFVFLGADVVEPIERGVSYPSRRKLNVLPLGPAPTSSTTDTGLSLTDILRRRYFSRIWVVQELLLSSQAVLRIGSAEYRATHQTPRDVVDANPKWAWNSTAAPWFQYICQGSLTGDSRESLLEIMKVTWSCHSADPRDKVFGVLGLNASAITIQPNYSISAQHTFIGISAHCLINLQDPRILSWASGIGQRGSYPSWVPAWGSPAMAPPPDLSHEALRKWERKWQDDFLALLHSRPLACFPGMLGDSEGEVGGVKEEGEHVDGNGEDDNYGKVPDTFRVHVSPITTAQEVPSWAKHPFHYDPHTKLNTLGGERETKLWHHITSVTAVSGALTIPLVHLFSIDYDPILVSQMDGMTCYLVPQGRKSRKQLAPYEKGRRLPNEFYEANPRLKNQGFQRPFLILTVRGVAQTCPVVTGDRLFFLDLGSQKPVFLVLREAEPSGSFSVVTSCHEVIFSTNVNSRIFTNYLHRTYILPKLFVTRNGYDGNPILPEVAKWLRCIFLSGEPRLEDVAAILQGYENERQNTQPGVIETYLNVMKTPLNHRNSTLSLMEGGVIRWYGGNQLLKSHVDNCQRTGLEHRGLQRCVWSRQQTNLMSDSESPEEEDYMVATTNAICNLLMESFEALGLHGRLRTNGYCVPGLRKLRNDFSAPPADLAKFPAGLTHQPWAIPDTWPMIYGKHNIVNEFGLDGNCYEVTIV